MMDQMACAVGGPVLFDFADRDNLKYSKLDFSFGKFGHKTGNRKHRKRPCRPEPGVL